MVILRRNIKQILLVLCSGIATTECFVPYASVKSTAFLQAKHQFVNKNIVALSSTEDDVVSEEIPAVAVVEEVPVAVVEEVAEVAVSEEEAPPAPEKPVEVIKVYLGNLPGNYLESNVRELLTAKTGGMTIAEVKVPLDRYTGNARGFAFVSFAKEGKDQTLKGVMTLLDGLEIDGTLVIVKEQKSRAEMEEENPTTKIYVGNIPFESTEEDVTDFMQQLGGTVTNCFLPYEAGRPRGFAFVTMGKEDAAKAMAELDGLDYNGRNLNIKESLPPGKSPPRRRARETKLYIGNISFQTFDETVRETFEEFGDVSDVYLPVDRETGRPRGFGFVTMGVEDAENAIEQLDGRDVDGRFWRVNIAQAKGKPVVDTWEEAP